MFCRGDTEIKKQQTMNAFNRKVGKSITTEAFIRSYDIAAYVAFVESCIMADPGTGLPFEILFQMFRLDVS